MPSGILWMAIAKAIVIPMLISSMAAIKVAKPSGKLWIPMARAVKMPVRLSAELVSNSGHHRIWKK